MVQDNQAWTDCPLCGANFALNGESIKIRGIIFQTVSLIHKYCYEHFEDFVKAIDSRNLSRSFDEFAYSIAKHVEDETQGYIDEEMILNIVDYELRTLIL